MYALAGGDLHRRAYSFEHAAHLASMAHTGDANELQADADRLHAEANKLDDLHQLQATTHHPHCLSHANRVGTDGWDYGFNEACSCHRNERIRQAGGKAKR